MSMFSVHAETETKHMSLFSTISLSSSPTGNIADGPISLQSSCLVTSFFYYPNALFDGDRRTWVSNVRTGATSQYDNFGFTRFFSYDGEDYGVAPGGVYKIGGSTDNGSGINVLVDFGVSSLGSAQKKRVRNVYLGADTSGKLSLIAEADGVSYTYEAISFTSEISNSRVDIGGGLVGNYWRFSLITLNGETVDLEQIAFEPQSLSRRI
jgi:hypothetical protein